MPAPARTTFGIEEIRDAEAGHEVARSQLVDGPVVTACEELAAEHFELAHGYLRYGVERVVGLGGRLRGIRRGEIETGVGAVVAFGFAEFQFVAEADVDGDFGRDFPIVLNVPGEHLEMLAVNRYG
jgi:hypothetical protein